MLESGKLQNMQNTQFQAVTPPQGGEPQVPMQAVNPELLKENIEDTYVVNRLTGEKEDIKGNIYTALMSVPAWLLISQLMDKYAAASRGDFDKTVHGKFSRFADNISNKVKESFLGKSAFGQFIGKKWTQTKAFTKKNFIDRFRITRAMAYTPSKPELDMVKGNANGGIGFVGFDCSQHDDAFLRPLKNIDNLGAYAGTSDDIKKYKDLISKALTAEEKANLQQLAEFECLSKYGRAGGKTGAALEVAMEEFKNLPSQARAMKLKDMKAFEWGYNSLAEMEAVKANMQENLPKVFEAATKANKKMYAYINGSESSAWQRFVHKFFGRKVYACETANKMAAFIGNMNMEQHKDWAEVLKRTGYDKVLPKTGFGKFFAKYANLVLEGATNRVAGGKLIAATQAIYLADVIYKSMKADGLSEKAKSFAERFAELLSFFICMPIAVQMMHKIGGLQYAGMTAEQVAKYREHLKFHNEKAMSGGFRTKLDCDVSAKALKRELNAGVKNPITKLFKRIGRIVTVGLEQIRPWDKKDIGVMKDGKKVFRKGIAEKLKDLIRHPKFGFKQMAGYPMRIIIGMAVLLPFLNKIAVKCSHLLFGKPKNSILDEGKEEKIPQNMPPTVLQDSQTSNLPNSQVNQQGTTAQTSLQPQGQPSSTNLLNKYINQHRANAQTPLQPQDLQPSSTNLLNNYVNQQRANAQTPAQHANNPQLSQSPTNLVKKYIDAQKNGKNDEPQEPVRIYVPSPIGVVQANGGDTSAVDKALRRAEEAEKLALQTLNMN